MTSDLIRKARAFAARAHDGQLRKYTNEPYIVHPISVAEIVKIVPHTPEMVAAALLHDTVEDTDTTLLEILDEFGPTVARYVDGLTDVSRKSDGNRAARKAIDRAYLSRQPPEVKTIKLADLIDNTKTITLYDPGFAKVYLEEKRLLLNVLIQGDLTLYNMAKRQIGA